MKHTAETPNIRIKNILTTISLATLCLFLSFAITAAPTVVKPIPNQVTHNGEHFSLDIPYSNFKDSDGNNLTFDIKQADDSELPNWLIVRERPFPKVVSTLDFGGAYANDVTASGDYLYVADHLQGLKVINVTDHENPALVDDSLDTQRAEGIKIVGNYAYIADYTAGLKIVDITDPLDPKEIGSKDTSQAYDVAISGNYAYIADGSAGLQIIDITNHTSPDALGVSDTLSANSIAVYGNYAYIADGEEGLKIINITDPMAPSQKTPLDTTQANGIDIDQNNYAYLADGPHGLKVIDISNPSNPNIVKYLSRTAQDWTDAKDVAISGNYAYVVDSDKSLLRVVDITDPSNPTFVSSLELYGTSNGVAIQGNYAYVAEGAEGITIVENVKPGLSISGVPSNADIGRLNLKVIVSNGAQEVTDEFHIDISNNTPIVSSSIPNKEAHFSNLFYSEIPYDTFQDPNKDNLYLDVSQSDNSTLPNWLKKRYICNLVDSLDLTRPNSVVLKGDYAYIADGSLGGLQIANISNPLNSTLAGSINEGCIAQDIAVLENYAYVACHYAGLKVFNITDPSTPGLTSYLYSTIESLGIDLTKDYAYVADGSGRFKIVDTTEPSLTLEVAEFNAGSTRGITVFQKHAYVTNMDGELQIINVENPKNPTHIYTLDLHSDDTNRVKLNGDFAYVTAGSDGLKVVNVTDPSTPTLIGELNTNYANGLDIVGKDLYLADGNSGIKIIDITTPTNPEILTSFNIGGTANDVAVRNNYVYVADETGALKTVQVKKFLVGRPESSNIGRLDLKATASDGTSEAAEEFYIDISNTAPSVTNPIGNHRAYNGKRFNLTINPYNVFTDLDKDPLSFSVKQENGTDLPAWLNLTKQFSPTLIDTISMYQPYKVVVNNNYAYVVGRDIGLNIIDIATPGNSTLVGQLDTYRAEGVDVLNNYAYVADRTEGLKIIDITTPIDPILKSSFSTGGSAYDVKVRGNYAYVANGYAGFKIVDVTDPTAPSTLDEVGIGTGDYANGVDLYDDYAYLSVHDEGIKIINITNPTNISLDNSLDLDIINYIYGVTINGNYAYVPNGVSGVKIFDITSPINPNLIYSEDSTNSVYEVIADDSHAYLAEADLGLKILDITNPLNIIAVGSFGENIGTSTGISLFNDRIYMADYTRGFRVINLKEYLLSGTPSSLDRGVLNLKATVSDGVNETSSLFQIDLNDIPIISDVSKSGTEDTILTFNVTDFTDHFDDAEGDNLAKIQVTSLPSNGALKLLGSNVAIDQEIDAVDLGNLTFEPDAHWNGNTSFAWKGYDGGDYSDSSANVNIQINAINDTPVVTTNQNPLFYDDCNSEVAIDNTIAITDVDSNLRSAKVKLIGGGVNLKVDSLSFVDRNGILGNYDDTVGELTLTGTESVPNYQTALRNVTYKHKGATVPTDSIMASFSVNDGLLSSDEVFRNITLGTNIASCDNSIWDNWGAVIIGGAIGTGIVAVTGGVTTAILCYYNQQKKRNLLIRGKEIGGSDISLKNL